MEPGETRSFTKIHDVPFDLDSAWVAVEGDDQRYFRSEIINLEQRVDNVINTFNLKLDEEALVGAELSITLEFTYFGGRETANASEEFTIHVVLIEELHADFSAEPQRGEAPLEVQFSNLSTGEIESYSWDFDDSGSSEDSEPTHTYEDPLSVRHYSVSLTVADEEDREDTRRRPNYITVIPQGGVEWDTLTYDDPNDITTMLSIPDEYDNGDAYFNVRFTPLYAPFYLMEVLLPLFDMWGDPGTPNLRVIIWQSGDIGGDSGFPVEPIDSIDVPFEDLIFSEGGVDYPPFNIIDLRPLEISFNDKIDFHIGANLIDDDDDNDHDTLGILMDDGEYDDNDRSGMWDGNLGEWSKLVETEGIMTPYNFAIHAVISPQPEGIPEILNPSPVPNTLLIDPAWPNPFNGVTSVRYNIPVGIPYTVALFNSDGRWIRDVDTGRGQGNGMLMIQANDIPTGTYFLRLSTPGESREVRLMYLK